MDVHFINNHYNKLDREERQAEVLVMEIIENIWLLKCPGCKV